MTIIKKCYLENRDKVIELLSSAANSIDSIDDLFSKLAEMSSVDKSCVGMSSVDKSQTLHFNPGQFINLCNFYRDICAKTTELAKNKLKAANGLASNSKISYGFDEEYMITAIFAGIKKYALGVFELAARWDPFLAQPHEGIAVSKDEICCVLAASVFGLTNGVNLLNIIANNDIIPFTCLLEYFNRRLDIDHRSDHLSSQLIIKSAENNVTEKALNKMCNLILAATETPLPRVMLFITDTSLYSSICYNQIHHAEPLGEKKAISYECNKNLEMPEIIARGIFQVSAEVENPAHNSVINHPMKPQRITCVFGAEYYSCIKPSGDISIKHQMYGVGAVHDKFPRATDGTVTRSVIFDEINPAFFRSTQKQTNITRILNYFDIFNSRIHFYTACCGALFIDTPQNSICVSVNPQVIKHIQILEFFAAVIAAGLEQRHIEFHTGGADTEDNSHDQGNNSGEFGEEFLAFMRKCRTNRICIADLYTAILEFIKKIKRDINNGYGEFDLMKVSFFDVI